MNKIKPILIFGGWLVGFRRFHKKKDAENFIEDEVVFCYSLKDTILMRKNLNYLVSKSEKRGYIMDINKVEIFLAVYWLKFWNVKTGLYLRIDKLLKGKYEKQI